MGARVWLEIDGELKSVEVNDKNAKILDGISKSLFHLTKDGPHQIACQLKEARSLICEGIVSRGEYE